MVISNDLAQMSEKTTTITQREYNELKYYGSSLNKFIREQCKIDMIVNNIDLVMCDFKTNRVRIIESKYINERAGLGQMGVLRRLREVFDRFAEYKDIDTATRHKFNNIRKELATVELFMIRGNPPYETATVVDVMTNNGDAHDMRGRVTLNQNELIQFLNFERELIDIVNERNQ